MTPLKLKHHALYSLIFLADSIDKPTPAIDGEGHTWSNRTCLAASCLPDCDGPTTIVVADAADAPRTEHQVFDGDIEFPSGFAVIDTIMDGVICEFPVTPGPHRVRLWTDGHRGTEILVFGLD